MHNKIKKRRMFPGLELFYKIISSCKIFYFPEIIKSKQAIMLPMLNVVILITSIVVFPNIDPVTSSSPVFQKNCTINTECEPNSCCLLGLFLFFFVYIKI